MKLRLINCDLCGSRLTQEEVMNRWHPTIWSIQTVRIRLKTKDSNHQPIDLCQRCETKALRNILNQRGNP